MVITPVVDAPEVLAEAEDVVELVDEKLNEDVAGEYGLATVALTLLPEVDGVAADGVAKAGAPRTNGIIHNRDSSLDSMAAARVDFWRKLG
jgi:hypothetical protein